MTGVTKEQALPLTSDQSEKYNQLRARILAGKASQKEAADAIAQLCQDNERLAVISGNNRSTMIAALDERDAAEERAKRAEGERVEAVNDAETFAALLATAYGASLDWHQILKDDALWFAQDDIAKSRVACMDAEATATALTAQVERLTDTVKKAANRLDWCAGLLPTDTSRDQATAWADETRAALKGATK
jgi:hypothetical protein